MVVHAEMGGRVGMPCSPGLGTCNNGKTNEMTSARKVSDAVFNHKKQLKEAETKCLVLNLPYINSYWFMERP